MLEFQRFLETFLIEQTTTLNDLQLKKSVHPTVSVSAKCRMFWIMWNVLSNVECFEQYEMFWKMWNVLDNVECFEQCAMF